MALPPDAQQRLDALRRFLVVDAPEEDVLDRLVRIAASVYGVEYAVLSLREGDGERVAAAHGVPAEAFGPEAPLIDLPPGPRLPLTVADATTDARFARNPLVRRETPDAGPPARFYAGVPLKSVHDFTLGTLAILDPEAQEMNGEGLALLVDLGALVEPALNLGQVEAERDAARQALAAAAAERDAARAEAADAGPWAPLLDAAPAPLAVAGPDGALLYANAAARQLLGLGEAVGGGRLADHLDAAAAPALEALLADPTTTPEVRLGERPYRLAGAAAPALGEGAVLVAFHEAVAGGEADAAVVAAAIDDAIAAVAAERDAVAAALVAKERELEARKTELLTATATVEAKERELVAAAEALAAHEEALRAAAAEVREKEAALHAAAEALAARDAEAEALHARRAALALDRDALAAAVHHELRSALTGVLGYADVLADDEDEARRDIGRTIVGASERLLRLLTGALHLNRLDADEPALEAVDTASVVGLVAAPFRAPAEARDLALYVEAPETPLYARADAAALGAVIEALLSNALAHTTQGGIRLRLTADDDHVVVEVQDTGAGMDEATLARVLAGGTAGVERRGGGHGVGLSLAHRLAERMGARIAGTSVPGQGSVLRLILRSASTPAPAAAPATPAASAPEPSGGDGALLHPSV